MRPKTQLEKQIIQIYAEANKITVEKAQEYIGTFVTEYDLELTNAKALTGRYTGMTPYQAEQQMKAWMNGKFTGEKWEAVKTRMAEEFTAADKAAAKIINDNSYKVCAKSANAEAKTIKIMARNYHLTPSFTIYNKETVKELNKTQKLLPEIKTRTEKATEWHRKQIQKSIQSGIIQGKSIDKIAGEIQNVTEMSEKASIRSARTAMTGSQNAGRQIIYDDCEKQGIHVYKQWLAATDDRTRDSHALMDGETVPYDEEFSNGLMYPGDPHGEPEEVWNCRCTMIPVLKGDK